MRMLLCFPGVGEIRRSFSFRMKFPSVPSIHLSKEVFMPIVFAVIGGFMGSSIGIVGFGGGVSGVIPGAIIGLIIGALLSR